MTMELKYYNDTSIPLTRFIDATIDKDLKALLREPLERDLTEEEAEELGQALLKINSDYLLLLEDASAMTYAQRLQRMSDLGLRLLRFRLAAESLSLVPAQLQKLEMLREEFGYELNPMDEAQFGQDLQDVLTELISDEIELERLENIEQEEQERQKKEAPQTRSGFEELLFEINHQEGVRYSMANLTLAGFATLVKRLRMHYKLKLLKAAP